MKKGFLLLGVFIFAGLLVFAQETILIDKIAKLYPPLKFTHEKHMEIAEGDCKKCHHFSGDKTPPCSACHAEGKIAVNLKEAYHGLCIKCHKEMAGPVSCKDCHGSPTKKFETLALSSISKLYEPVNFSHGRHISFTKDCKDCHHKGEEKTYSCSFCHSKEDLYKYEAGKVAVGLKGAYHGLCLSCHKKEGKGPLKCTECHKRKAKR